MSKLSLWRTISFVCVFCAIESIGSPAQTFKTLVSFNGTDGQSPEPLVQGLDGNFYGTTVNGGANNWGTIFKITPAGTLTTLYSFCSLPNCTDGGIPNGGLVQATNGNFYGTTNYGGTSYQKVGTVFKITPAGKLTTLYSFCGNKSYCTDGANPVAGLIQATDGNFYGTTGGGGANNSCGGSGCGTVFKITSAGKLTTLYSFAGYPTDGAYPHAGLIQATDGNFYGTTSQGGTNNSCGGSGCGTVFKITSAGKLTTLYSFAGYPTDGAYPYAGLIHATDGNFYGTTFYGGTHRDGGTVFKITPAGRLTTLYTFCVNKSYCTDGANPVAGLLQATDGKFYGTTFYGGTHRDGGTVFKITPAGKLTLLFSFNVTDGAGAFGLLQATDGKFYGTTGGGGAYSYGTVFSLGVGLGPFVEMLPTSGKVGAHVTVLGNNLKGTSSVTFNGTAATFTVVSSTEIKTTVPVSATTGFVKVTSPKKTLKSNVVFRVTN